MATTASKATRFTDVNQSRVEQAAHLAGIAEAFGRAAELGPEVLEMQQSLLGGIVRSQQREADRLAARLGKGDPRVARASDRAQRVQQMHAELSGHGQQLANLVEGFRRDGSFSGYVLRADGAPAPEHLVRIEVVELAGKRSRRGSAKTDATGHFIMLLADPASDSKKDSGGLQRLAENLLRQLPVDAEPADEVDGERRSGTTAAQAAGQTPRAAAAASAESAASAATTATQDQPKFSSRVEVLNPSGQLVLEDPLPPTFEVLASEFRCYVLSDSSTPKATAKTTDKTTDKTTKAG